MRDAEAVVGAPLDVVEVLDYGQGATHDVVLVARREDPEARYVVKRARGDPGPLLRERAALDAYAEHAASAALVPRVIGGADDGVLLVVEALPFTDADRLGVLLEGDDPQRARAALRAHMRALAVLNGVPAWESFERRMAEHSALTVSRHAVHHLAAHLIALPEPLASLGGTPGDVAAEIAVASDALEHPGDFRSLSHGDGTAANTFVTVEGRAYVIDFETAGARHAALDGVFGCIRYLNSVWALEVPADLRSEAMCTFRAALSEHIPHAADDRLWRVDETHAAAAWLAMLLRRPERYLDDDTRWGRSGIRWRVFTGLTRFVEIAHEPDWMPATADACKRAATALRERWPEEHRTARMYRAFTGQE